MTATDELRRLLDERGVEWEDDSEEWIKHTSWNDANCWFNEYPDGLTAWGMINRGTPVQAINATLWNDGAERSNDGVAERERDQPPYAELIALLARDWGIEASWDGLRHFWYIGLTEECVRNRDEINEQLEDENAKLREDMEDMEGYDQMLRDERRQERELYVKAKAENDKLRKEKESLVSSLNRAEDRWLTLRDRLEGCVETWRRFEGREPEGIMLALKLMLEIIETERKES